jgi:hypothetical protein
MLAANGKGLAKRAAEHYFNLSRVRLEIVSANVTLNDVPVMDIFHAVGFVTMKRSAGIPVPIKDGRVQ